MYSGRPTEKRRLGGEWGKAECLHKAEGQRRPLLKNKPGNGEFKQGATHLNIKGGRKKSERRNVGKKEGKRAVQRWTKRETREEKPHLPIKG